MSTGQLYGEAFTAFLGNEYNCVPFCSAYRMGRKRGIKGEHTVAELQSCWDNGQMVEYDMWLECCNGLNSLGKIGQGGEEVELHFVFNLYFSKVQ